MLQSKHYALQMNLREHIYNNEKRSIKVINFSETPQRGDSYHVQSTSPYVRVREFSSFAMHAQPRFIDYRSPRYNCLLKKNAKAADAPWRTATVQLLGCSWRCWYCYVDATNLAKSSPHAREIGIAELCDEILSLPLDIIDLSGGQPDLVPEWVSITHDRLSRLGDGSSVHLRSEDNLSNDCLWRFLGDKEARRLATSDRYTRVGCFKGFDEESYVNVVGKAGSLDDQFACAERLFETGFDPFYYATFSPGTVDRIEMRVRAFFERLQRISEWLPLRIVPLSLRKTSNWNRGRTMSFDEETSRSDCANQIWFELISEAFGDDAFETELADLLNG